MIHLDGSFGEGGGQILRTSLALSLVTDKAGIFLFIPIHAVLQAGKAGIFLLLSIHVVLQAGKTGIFLLIPIHVVLQAGTFYLTIHTPDVSMRHYI